MHTREVSPPGWDDVVKAIKGKVDNPWATAWAMVDKGYQRHSKEGRPYHPFALLRRFQHESRSREATGIAALGQLARKSVKESLRESAVHPIVEFTTFREAAAPAATATDGDSGATPRVVLITAGPGNVHDGNFYPPEVIERDVPMFEGVKCFLNHPGRMDEENRPEREVQIIAGWFSNIQATPVDSQTAAVANLRYTADLSDQLTAAGSQAKGLIESAIVYQRQYPDKVLVGFSINAEGPSHEVDAQTLIQQYPQFEQRLQERDTWNVVDGIAGAMSVDLVTFPARGGKVLGLVEARRRMASQRWRAQFAAVLRAA